MDTLLAFGLTNALVAALLAAAAAAIARLTAHPALWYALWLVVLVRLVTPPVVGVDVPIPELGGAQAGLGGAAVEISGGTVAIADTGPLITAAGAAAGLWIAGALVVLGFALAQSIQLRQILRTAEPASDIVVERVAELSRRLGLRRAPPTVEVLDRVPPMLWAFIGSVRLILPVELLARLDAPQMDTLLAHELAHLRRRDHWVRHLELAALALFWWNPVAWWATHRLRRAQELCCDERVAELLPEHRRRYADTLVETARFLSGRKLPLGSPARAMADLSHMKGRIHMIMKTDRRRQLSLPIRLVAAAILLAVLAVTPVLTAGPDKAAATGEPISLRLAEAELNDVLATFSKVTGKEILIEPGVAGKVTASIDNEPWDDALATILESMDLTYEEVGDQIIVRRTGAGRSSSPKPPNSLAQPAEPGVQKVHKFIKGGDITEPRAREKLAPKYPEEARKQGIGGAVVAELVIDESGIVRDVEIKESPTPELGSAAHDAFEHWTFDPATKDGEPVAVSYIVTVMFRLE